MHVFVCVCTCVCVRDGEKDSEKGKRNNTEKWELLDCVLSVELLAIKQSNLEGIAQLQRSRLLFTELSFYPSYMTPLSWHLEGGERRWWGGRGVTREERGREKSTCIVKHYLSVVLLQVRSIKRGWNTKIDPLMEMLALVHRQVKRKDREGDKRAKKERKKRDGKKRELKKKSSQWPECHLFNFCDSHRVHSCQSVLEQDIEPPPSPGCPWSLLGWNVCI